MVDRGYLQPMQIHGFKSSWQPKLCFLFDNIIIMGDFNSELHEDDMSEFCALYNMTNHVQEPCCIDLILINGGRNFQNTITVETGWPDFHKMMATYVKPILRRAFQKLCLIGL